MSSLRQRIAYLAFVYRLTCRLNYGGYSYSASRRLASKHRRWLVESGQRVRRAGA